MHLLKISAQFVIKHSISPSLDLANSVKDERPQSLLGAAPAPDWPQFSARHQTLAVRRYGLVIIRLQQQSHPNKAVWWLSP